MIYLEYFNASDNNGCLFDINRFQDWTASSNSHSSTELNIIFSHSSIFICFYYPSDLSSKLFNPRLLSLIINIYFFCFNDPLQN